MPSTIPEIPQMSMNLKPIFKWIRGAFIREGTYGRVYLALNATSGELIAVKQVELAKANNDNDDNSKINRVEALRNESEMLKDIDHPNIVQYLGFEQTSDFLSIFFDYVPGGSLAEMLRKYGTIDDPLARSFTAHILTGLEYLHENGIIHRDIKADHVLVDLSSVCKISGFGASIRTDSTTDNINANVQFKPPQGPIFWMAPEVLAHSVEDRNQDKYSRKMDIWSLGCVLLEMWTGRRPWDDLPAVAVINELFTNVAVPPVPPEVVLSPEADDLRKKCFTFNPEERPTASDLRKHPYLIHQSD